MDVWWPAYFYPQILLSFKAVWSSGFHDSGASHVTVLVTSTVHPLWVTSKNEEWIFVFIVYYGATFPVFLMKIKSPCSRIWNFYWCAAACGQILVHVRITYIEMTCSIDTWILCGRSAWSDEISGKHIWLAISQNSSDMCHKDSYDICSNKHSLMTVCRLSHS